MKIAIVCDYIGPAKNSMGAERMIESLAKAYISLGHEVVMKVNPASINMPAPIVEEIPSDCDVISFNGWDAETSEKEFSSYGIPWVTTLHGGGSENDPKWLETVKNPHMICVSKFVADRIGTKAYAWTCSDPDDFILRAQKENYFLWMAGTDWGEGKGLFSAISLAKKMRINLKIAGTGTNQSVIEQIKQQCTDKIEFVGAVNGKEKAELLSRAKGFLLLTRLPDACPLTFSEAMLSGTPVITFPNGSMPELMDSGTEKVGFVCHSDADLAKAVLNVKHIAPENCYNHGTRNFTHLATAKKYLQYMQNIIEFGNVQGEQHD